MKINVAVHEQSNLGCLGFFSIHCIELCVGMYDKCQFSCMSWRFLNTLWSCVHPWSYTQVLADGAPWIYWQVQVGFISTLPWWVFLRVVMLVLSYWLFTNYCFGKCLQTACCYFTAMLMTLNNPEYPEAELISSPAIFNQVNNLFLYIPWIVLFTSFPSYEPWHHLRVSFFFFGHDISMTSRVMKTTQSQSVTGSSLFCSRNHHSFVKPDRLIIAVVFCWRSWICWNVLGI